MKLEGAQVIAADRMAVWNAINDPEILKRCISGCEEMTRTSPTQYEAVVKQKIGPVSATFQGAVELTDVTEGESLRLNGVGKGGVAGMAKGGALISLSDVEGGTRLSYEADASVAGKLAQLGSRLIDGVAQKMINSFFARFKDEVESGPGGMRAAPVQAAPVQADSMQSAPESVHDTGAGGVAMAAAIGAVGVAGEATTARASASARDARNDADARTGALHDAAAERMLNPAIGAGAGEIDMDDPEIGDIDVSSVDGGPSEAEANAASAARAAGSQGDGATTVDVAGNLSTMAGSFDPEGGSMRDHVGAEGRNVSASGASGAGAMAAADRVGERVSADASGAQAQAEAMRAQAANASRSAMEGAREGAADMQGHAAASGAAPISTMPPSPPSGSPGAAPEAPEARVTDPGDTRISGASAAASAAAVGGIGAAVSGFAARAQGTFDETHDKVRERVIAAGAEVDESKSWNDTKEHLSRAASETRDTAQDVYDAARARIEGDKDRAKAEWSDARTNAGDTVRELKGAGEDAWSTGKGYAAEEAKAPKIGPLGQPWYLWIIGVIVLLVILWIL